MKEKKAEISINASPGEVWRVLANLEAWNQWNPTIREVVGEAKLGNKLKVTMKAGGKSGTVLKPVITKLDDQKCLVWTTSLAGGLLFKNQKVVRLEESDQGTRLVHKELYGGLLPTLTWGSFKNAVEPMLQAMNKGLKKEVENYVN